MSGTTYPRFAGFDASFDSFTPLQLFSGDRDVTTNTGTLVSGQDLAQYAVVALDANNKLIAHDPGAVADLDASGDVVNVPTSVSRAIGILCDAVDATGGDTACRYYDAGTFNPAALVWHADTNTLAERIAAFAGTAIQIRALG